jgi:hypothetical protein
MESGGTLPRRNWIVAITGAVYMLYEDWRKSDSTRLTLGNAREGHKKSAIDAGMDMVFVKVSLGPPPNGAETELQFEYS